MTCQKSHSQSGQANIQTQTLCLRTTLTTIITNTNIDIEKYEQSI